MNLRFLSASILFLTCLGSAFPEDCTFQWHSTDLETNAIGPKDYYGDTNIAYAIFEFQPDPDTVYRFEGTFPHARYMSIESSRLLDIGNWDFDDIQDHEIVADTGSHNPFKPGVPLDAEPRHFTVDAVPGGAHWEATNRLDIPADGEINTIWLRIAAPNRDISITFDDLPTIQALDLATGDPKECSPSPSSHAAVQIPAVSYSGLPGAIYAPQLIDLDDLLQLIGQLIPEKTWVFNFRVHHIPFEGSSAAPGYATGASKMPIGKVAMVKFKAPSFINTYPGIGRFCPLGDLRYWSLCMLDIYHGEGLACLPDHLAATDSRGFVTLVFGPEGGDVERKARELGYNFLPDLREPVVDDEMKVMNFVYRQLLPSWKFSWTGLHKGDYLPRARICSAHAFLTDSCKIRW